MGEGLRRTLAVLQVSRIALVFTAIADIWLIVLLSRAVDSGGRWTQALHELPLWAVLLCTAVIASGLYVFGMVLNDVMDLRRDRTFAPERPLPSRRIGLPETVALAVAALMMAVMAAVPLGAMSTLMCLAAAVLILFYDALGKHLPGTGIVTLGLIRAVHMMIANPALGFLWPVWLTLSHVIGASAAGYRLEGKRPRLEGRSLWMVIGGWAFLTVLLIGWMDYRDGLVLSGYGWIWLGPAIAAVAFVGTAVATVRRAKTTGAGGGLMMKRALQWLIIYDASWLLSAGLWWQGAMVAALLVLALGAMAAIRQMKAFSEPMVFRSEG